MLRPAAVLTVLVFPACLAFPPPDGCDENCQSPPGGDEGIATDADGPTGAGFLISKDTLVVSESGVQDSFRVSLRTPPVTRVFLTLDASPAGRVKFDPPIVALSTTNWSTGVVVSVTGLDDDPPVVDGDEPVTVMLGTASSVDPSYSGLSAPDVHVTSVDDDVAAIVLSSKQGQVLLENAPAVTLTKVSLATQPVDPVTVPVGVDPGGRATVSPALIHFDATNWNIPVSVSVTAVNDDLRNLDAELQVSFGPASGDQAYAGQTAGTIKVPVLDEERLIVPLPDVRQGDLRTTGTDVTGLPAVDAACAAQTGGAFKALLIAGGRNPSAPASWVLKPFYNYLRLDGTVIGRANERGELFALQNGTTGAAGRYWTGVMVTLVPPSTYVWDPGPTCADWSSASATEASGVEGSGTVTTFNAFAAGNILCSEYRTVLCAEQ